MGQIQGIKLDGAHPAPLYQQLVEALSHRIRSGVLPEGYRLPPTRDLATQLEVHRNTVVRAFEELNSLGFVHARVGRGTFVADSSSWSSLGARAVASVEPGPVLSEPLPWDALFSQAIDAEPLARSGRLGRGLGPGSWINLAKMEPPRECLPVEHFRLCIEHVLRSKGGRALGYAPAGGLRELRECIVQELADKGIPARPEDVVITTGSQQGLDVISRALLDPGDAMLMQSTTYTGALHIIASCGGRSVGVVCDDEGPSMQVLSRLGSSRAKAFYLMPNVCNPTGLCISARRREELIEWSHGCGVPLLEDDYAADLELDGERPPPALRALDPEVIYMSTYSKKLIPSLRVGYLVCPAAVRRRILPLKQSMDLGTSALLQYALCEFLERGYLRAHLRALLAAMRERRDALEASLKEHLPQEIQWKHAVRGPLLWLALPPELPPELVFEEARRQGVLVGPGSLYEAGVAPQERGIRLVFCSENPERLAEAGKRLGAVFARLLEQVGRLAEHERQSPTLDGA